MDLEPGGRRLPDHWREREAADLCGTTVTAVTGANDANTLFRLEGSNGA
ncbi:hypothetical protein [Natrialba taiwanensis]|nr:hypothetical protein [Natrialba taiwanensis]